MTRYLNLVFQGGGVRGIAYAGVLSELPPDYVIKGVAGTSAGSIVAALIATGVGSAPQLKSILSDPALFKLVAQEDLERTRRLNLAYKEIWPLLLQGLQGKNKWWLFQIPLLVKKHKQAIADIANIWEKKGLHNSDRLQDWLEKQFGKKRFSDIDAQILDLKVVAADVSERCYKIYSKEATPNEYIANAVRASASIPVFFNPYPAAGAGFQVDGGLLSNFPAFLFAQSSYPTLGFRLNDLTPPEKIDSCADYLRSLIHTMTDAHDKIRDLPSSFRSITIKTPKTIPSFKFDLSVDDVDRLYEAGVAATTEVDWEKSSSTKPIVLYYDRNAVGTLEFSLRQTSALHDAYNSKQFWVKQLKNEVVFTVRIERDWSAEYESLTILTVEDGDRPLFASEFRAYGVPPDGGGPISLIDFDCKVVEIKSDATEKEVIYIPAVNTKDVKGYVAFFVPPIYKGESRTIRKRFRIPREFSRSNSLSGGFPDDVSYQIKRLAEDHSYTLLFRVLVDTDLPAFSVCSDFSNTTNRKEEFLTETQRAYRVYESSAAARAIVTTQTFSVRMGESFPS